MLECKGLVGSVSYTAILTHTLASCVHSLQRTLTRSSRGAVKQRHLNQLLLDLDHVQRHFWPEATMAAQAARGSHASLLLDSGMPGLYGVHEHALDSLQSHIWRHSQRLQSGFCGCL